MLPEQHRHEVKRALSSAMTALLSCPPSESEDMPSELAARLLEDINGRDEDVPALRRRMLLLHQALESTKRSLAAKSEKMGATSRAGFLRSLNELIGKPPQGVSWDSPSA
eukprot:6349059-Prymnesium_polylepis.1